MTIRKGQDWGERGALPAGAPVADDDRGAALAVQAARASSQDTPEVGLLGGDLHRTLGEPHHDELDLRRGDAMRFPMDLGTVRIDDGEPIAFVAHLIATGSSGDRLWSTRTITVMNGSFAGAANLGPRAHPNDGRLDLVDGMLPRGQRRAGRRRALSGTHLPHPDLSERRITHHVVEAATPLHVRVDGQPVGTGSRLEIECHPDAWIAVV